MTGWNTAQERAKQGGGSSIFIRLADDGEKFVGTFCGEPHVRELVWSQKLNRYEDYNKDVHDPQGIKPSPRFILNVYVPAEKRMCVFEMNNGTFQDVLKVREKYGVGSLAFKGSKEKHEYFLSVFEVERKGKKGNTKTTYSILYDSKLEDEHLKVMSELSLHDLAKVTENDADDSTDMSSHDKKKEAAKAEAAKPDTVIKDEESADLVRRLKLIPKEKVPTFLQKFGIQQVRQLKSSQLAAAQAFCTELEGKPPPPPPAPAEVDPFA